MRRTTSPSISTARSKRSARAVATVVFPLAGTPVITQIASRTGSGHDASVGDRAAGQDVRQSLVDRWFDDAHHGFGRSDSRRTRDRLDPWADPGEQQAL